MQKSKPVAGIKHNKGQCGTLELFMFTYLESHEMFIFVYLHTFVVYMRCLCLLVYISTLLFTGVV